jgi:hypothetical protein
MKAYRQSPQQRRATVLPNDLRGNEAQSYIFRKNCVITYSLLLAYGKTIWPQPEKRQPEKLSTVFNTLMRAKSAHWGGNVSHVFFCPAG